MENSIRKTIKKGEEKILKVCALVFSSIMLFAYNAEAQDGPSLGNLNKNLTAAKEQMTHQEKMNYIFMSVGFILVMAIAWFSTSAAKKRKMEKDELIRKRHLNNTHVKHSMHDPYWKAKGQGAAKVRPK